MHANEPEMAKKWEKKMKNESDLGLTYKKGKTIKVKHKTSGKRLVVVDKPAVRKEYEKIGYFAEGTTTPFPSALIDKAIKVAKSMGGNMTGAVKKIEKIKRGLSKNGRVEYALQQANESVDEGFGGELEGKDKEKFEKARKENAEQLGYKLTGESDIREAVKILKGRRSNWLVEAIKVRNGETPMEGKWDVYDISTGKAIKEVGNARAATKLMNRLMNSGQYKEVAAKWAGESVNEAGTKSIDGIELLTFLMKRFNYSKKKAIDVMKKHKMDTSFLKNESVNEAKSKTMKTIGSIIGKKQAQKISGVLVDMQSALVIMKVWNALNPSNRSKFEKLPIKKMANVAWKLMK